MGTFRCLSCGGVYVDAQPGGVVYFHACGERLDHATGKRAPYPNARNENIAQDVPGGPVHMVSAGAGRELLSLDDLLTGATPEEIAAVLERPAIGESPLPDPPEPHKYTGIQPGGNR